MTNQTFIIAGSIAEYKDYCDHHIGTFTYLTSIEQLKGVKKPKFVMTGKFNENNLILNNQLKEYGI